jgi:Ricin-type beta-trefoil lectin domain
MFKFVARALSLLMVVAVGIGIWSAPASASGFPNVRFGDYPFKIYCLDSDPSGNVFYQHCNGSNSQAWQEILKSFDGTNLINNYQNVATGLCLTAHPTNPFAATCNTFPNQLFIFQGSTQLLINTAFDICVARSGSNEISAPRLSACRTFPTKLDSQWMRTQTIL